VKPPRKKSPPNTSGSSGERLFGKHAARQVEVCAAGHTHASSVRCRERQEQVASRATSTRILRALGDIPGTRRQWQRAQMRAAPRGETAAQDARHSHNHLLVEYQRGSSDGSSEQRRRLRGDGSGGARDEALKAAAPTAAAAAAARAATTRARTRRAEPPRRRLQ
jgi:hypothetical protein